MLVTNYSKQKENNALSEGEEMVWTAYQTMELNAKFQQNSQQKIWQGIQFGIIHVHNRPQGLLTYLTITVHKQKKVM